MSTENNKNIVRLFIEKVVNTGDFADIKKYTSPTFCEEAKSHILAVRKTFPDLHLTIEQQIAEGDWVATRVTARGTHKGEWVGMKPTNKKVEISGVNIDKVIDDFIVEHGGAANIFEALLEIGAIKPVS